ncbi:hypothetical protein VTL71DRAFT_11251 [Oculimacula yallundae]|uniref:Uncharacterized protein n=1 Tax=Oculimacula yallundae TaxID=86028 RepID=A0ABR4CVF2_9HELO
MLSMCLELSCVREIRQRNNEEFRNRMTYSALGLTVAATDASAFITRHVVGAVAVTVTAGVDEGCGGGKHFDMIEIG